MYVNNFNRERERKKHVEVQNVLTKRAYVPQSKTWLDESMTTTTAAVPYCSLEVFMNIFDEFRS